MIVLFSTYANFQRCKIASESKVDSIAQLRGCIGLHLPTYSRWYLRKSCARKELDLSYFICLRHLIRSRAVTNWIFFSEKKQSWYKISVKRTGRNDTLAYICFELLRNSIIALRELTIGKTSLCSDFSPCESD